MDNLLSALWNIQPIRKQYKHFLNSDCPGVSFLNFDMSDILASALSITQMKFNVRTNKGSNKTQKKVRQKSFVWSNQNRNMKTSCRKLRSQ